MTTSSDRVLLRWLPLAVLLAAAAAVLLTVIPHPFGYHSWPRPGASSPPLQVVRVSSFAASDRSLAAPPAVPSIARRQTPVLTPRRDASVRHPASGHRSGTRVATPSHAGRSGGERGPDRSGGRSHGHGGGSHSHGGSKSGRGSGSSGHGRGPSAGRSLAQVSHVMPPTAQAKSGPELAPPPGHRPKPKHRVHVRFGHGHHGRGHGQGRHRHAHGSHDRH